MHHSPSISVRCLLSSILLLTSLALFYPLTISLLAQLHVNSAEKNIIALQYSSAVEELKQAAELQPNDFRIYNELGNVYYKLGSKEQGSSEALQMLGKAREHFQHALRLHSLDARSAYGLARTEIYIEKINYLSGKGSNPPEDSPALNALEQAIALRPASTIYRLVYARYLYLYDETDKLLSEVRNLGRLQPSLYGSLRGEPFWSPAARKEFFAGVEQALALGVTPRQSLLVASGIMAEEKSWVEALSFRQQGMAVQSSLNLSGDFIRLGSLYLMADEPEQASENFFQALTISNNIEKDIISIMRVCKNADDPQALLDFYQEAGKKYGTSSMMNISAARFMIELQDFENARTILNNSNARQPDGEAYYLLARIAEKEQDWDQVELSIQKAAMHDPQNSNYHLMFSGILNRLQKYERAEKEAGLAMQHIDNAPAGLFHYRASLRMKINNYEGALADWLEAIKLEPQKASYLYHAGDVSEKLDRIDEAAEYFKKAIELEPGNKTYTKRLERIVKKYGTAPEVP